jgi:hypothetical protein
LLAQLGMQLGSKDRERILEVIKTSDDARVIYRANALNLRRKNLTLAEVADFLEITSRTVFSIEQNYEQFGLDRALNDDPRPVAPEEFDDRIKSQIVALVSSDPPEGFDRWTLRLLRESESNQRRSCRFHFTRDDWAHFRRA